MCVDFVLVCFIISFIIIKLKYLILLYIMLSGSNTLRLEPMSVLDEFKYENLNSVSEAIANLNGNSLIPPSDTYNKYGCLIIKSRRDENYYLIFKDESSKDQYLKYLNYSISVKPLMDGIYSTDKILSVINCLNDNLFNKKKNPYPIKLKCINIPSYSSDFMVKYSIDMKDESKIYHNVALNSLPRNESVPTYYTFLLDVNGIHYGYYENLLEMGTAHQFLIRDNSTDVFIGGEIKIDGQNVIFNFMSGTFSIDLRLESTPLLYRLYIELFTNIFGLHQSDLKTRFLTITFTEDVLFEKINPSKKSIRHMCLQPNTQTNVVVLDEGVRCVNNSVRDLTQIQRARANNDLATGKNLLCKNLEYQYDTKYLKNAADIVNYWKKKYIKYKIKYQNLKNKLI